MSILGTCYVEVEDREEIALLLTYGFEPVPHAGFDKVKESHRDRSTWRFPRVHGEHVAADLLRKWRSGEKFNATAESHPVAWMSRFSANRRAVDAAIADKREQILVARGNSIGLIDPQDSQAEQDRVLQLLRI